MQEHIIHLKSHELHGEVKATPGSTLSALRKKNNKIRSITLTDPCVPSPVQTFFLPHHC